MAGFADKWKAHAQTKPKAGQKSAVDTFKKKVEEQLDLLKQYEKQMGDFSKWRSTWFQRVAGGYGITVGRDAIDAGSGVNYVVVPDTDAVREFLKDLSEHASTDMEFQKALDANRSRRAALLAGAKAGVGTGKAKPKAK